MEFNYYIKKITPTNLKKIPPLNITYGSTDSKFGTCVMGLQEDNFCFVHFGNLDTGFQAQLFDREASGNIKLFLKGTEFEMQVWEHLIYLPKGKTTCYQEVAKGIGHPNAVRAVANAIAKNKIAFFVPCHRVLSKDGTLNNFKWGLEIKRSLLLHERN